MTDTDERVGLVRGICERPFNDALRLIYAEWLDEVSAEGGGVACEACNGDGGEEKYPADDPTNKMMHGSHWYNCRDCSGTGRVWPDAEHAAFIRASIQLERVATPEMVADRRWRDLRYSFYRPIDELRRAAFGGIARGRELGWFALMGHLGSQPVSQDVCWYVRNPSGDIHNNLRIEGTVRRGFIDSISLPGGAFTEAVARAAFGEQPIVTVHLSDREPGHSYQNFFYWESAEYDGGSFSRAESRMIPRRFLDRLTGFTQATRRDGGRGDGTGNPQRGYPSRELAQASLSAAAVSWGRHLAGLDHPSTTRT